MNSRNDFTLMEAFNDLTAETRFWLLAIAKELERAQVQHPTWPEDVIHRAAIVSEEAGELIRASINYQIEGLPCDEMMKEGIQTGAMAIRFLQATFHPIEDLAALKKEREPILDDGEASRP